MTEKRFITILLISLVVIGTLIYAGGRNSYNPENPRIDFAYTFSSKEELSEFVNEKVDEFKWIHAPFGTTKLEYGDERYTILRISLDEKLYSEKALYFRFRSKVYELYVDGVLIKRNGEVLGDDFYTEITSYSEIKLPLHSQYQGKEIIILLGSPVSFDITNIEKAEIISTIDFFNSYNLLDVITAFFIMIAMIVSGLAALNIYWMRFNFGGKLYKVIIPLWLILGSFLFDTPYIRMNYFNGRGVSSLVSVILGTLGIFIIAYSAKRTARNRPLKLAIDIFIVFMWVFIANMIVLVILQIVNLSFVLYLQEKIIMGMALPVFIYCYIHTKYLDKVFVKPFRIFFGASMIICISCYILYNIQPYFTIVLALNFAILYMVFALIILSSYIINTFHTNLFVELRNVSAENDIYRHIELSRENVSSNRTNENQDEYSNLSIEYVKSIVQGEMVATSIVLKEGPNDEMSIVRVRNSFGKARISSQEANYYLTIYNSTFVSKNINAVQEGKTLYLGFKQDNLIYFMVIRSNEVIGPLKIKALKTYATGIKNNAQNYVITNYVEEARNDVIKSFGKTIESRVESNNIIGITDRFVVFIARALGKPEEEVQTLKTASYLKNIGSIIMSEKELNDYNKMNREELKNAYKRSDNAYMILKKFDDEILSKAATMAKYQFESYDGSGHLGLIGEEIPDEGKIIKLAICMTSVFRGKKDLDIDHMFNEVMTHVETRYKDVVSPYYVEKCKDNFGIFDEIFFKNKVEVDSLIKEIADLDPDNFIF